jgi:hypothetical protein
LVDPNAGGVEGASAIGGKASGLLGGIKRDRSTLGRAAEEEEEKGEQQRTSEERHGKDKGKGQRAKGRSVSVKVCAYTQRGVRGAAKDSLQHQEVPSCCY